jgi:hypothetical protein
MTGGTGTDSNMVPNVFLFLVRSSRSARSVLIADHSTMMRCRWAASLARRVGTEAPAYRALPQPHGVAAPIVALLRDGTAAARVPQAVHEDET